MDQALRDLERTQATLQTLRQQHNEERLRQQVAQQVQQAHLQPPLPLPAQPVDPVTQFYRQVWRRRNTV